MKSSAKVVTDCNAWTVQHEVVRDRSARSGLRWPRDVQHQDHCLDRAWRACRIWKSTADTVSGKTPVGNRVYFRAVRDGNLFQVEGTGSEIFLGPDRSIADGRFYTFVSMRQRSSRRCVRMRSQAPFAALSIQAPFAALPSSPPPRSCCRSTGSLFPGATGSRLSIAKVACCTTPTAGCRFARTCSRS